MTLNRTSRPTLQERYSDLLDLSTLNIWIESLEVAYYENPNEKVFAVLQSMKHFKQSRTDDFWRMEDLYRNEELREFFENPGAYPHSVRVWMLSYREQENA